MSVRVPRRGSRGVFWPRLPTWLVTFAMRLQRRRFRSTGGARTQGGVHSRPDATIEFGDGRRVEVHAETLEGAELDQAWRRIEAEAPEYEGYRSKTDREIPVVRLRQRA